jgi:S-DNA-T family DNA segregation ATPase FtsK/SpoIIIE
LTKYVSGPYHGSSQRSRVEKTSPAKKSQAKSRGFVRHPKKDPLLFRLLDKIEIPKIPWNRISHEHRVDILGGVIFSVGLLTLLAIIASKNVNAFENSTTMLMIAAGWLVILSNIFGVALYLFPLCMLGIGIWTVLRKIPTIPTLSSERLVGVLLVFLNLLALVHILTGGGWALAREGGGGGYVGAFFEMLLVEGFGLPGALLILPVWLLVGMVLILDVSFTTIFQKILKGLAGLRDRAYQSVSQAADAIDGNPAPAKVVQQAKDNRDLPPGFNPLPPLSPIKRAALARATSVAGIGKPADAVKDIQPPKLYKPIAESGIPVMEADAQPSPNWLLPKIADILDPGSPMLLQTNFDKDRARQIEETLYSFGAPAHIVEIHRGPSVTQFGVEPDFIENRKGRTRVRVSRIVSLSDDLALVLAAPSIRIQAPVPGRNYVGIEVPNSEVSLVALRDILESEVFHRKKTPLRFALGKDVSGKPYATNLDNMPHLLIAGATNSGKSVCENVILCSLLLNNTPANLKLVLVDPKRVELTQYNGIPHLLAPVVVEPDRVVAVLQWVMREMDMRYEKFAKAKTRNITEYNATQPDKLPNLVMVVDELSDLMMRAPEETEHCITRLAQLSRATGIHLIIATQRPSTDVITGRIKANFPARIAFAVTSNVDSRVILDQPGAEKLLGKGDMLFQAPDSPAPVRLQGCYVSDGEILRLVDHWRLQGMNINPTLPAGQTLQIDSLPGGVPLKQVPLWDEPAAKGSNEDPIMKESIELVRRAGKASISMLQRRLGIGYSRAARLIDAMEDQGIIAPAYPGAPSREVLDYGESAPPPESE